MAAGIYNLVIEQGATFRRIFTVTEPDDSLMNLTNYEARMHIRKDYDSPTTLLSLSEDNSMIELGGTLGTVTIVIPATDTADLDRDGVYDLELIAPDGEVTRLLKGRVRLDREVTKEPRSKTKTFSTDAILVET